MPIHEKTTFQYLRWEEKFLKEKPYDILSGTSTNTPGDIPATNMVFEKNTQEELVGDVRGEEALYTLDTHGFAFHPTDTKFSAFYDRRKVEEEYIPQVVEPFLKQHVEGADRIVIFDWHLRRNARDTSAGYQDLNDGSQPLMPASRVHVDQSPDGAVRRVRHHVREGAEEALKRRVRLINFWKPLWNPVEDAPLALCDGSTVRECDLIPADLVTSNYVGEAAWMAPNPAFKWYYLRKQRPNEATLLKIFDSSSQCKARWCPHSSFKPSNVPPDAIPRESIEVRAIIITDPYY